MARRTTTSSPKTSRPALLGPAFVGREAESARLVAAISTPPAVVLLEGEAGIGKSRLVHEFLATELGNPEQTLVMGCLPFRQPPTLGPVIEALRQRPRGVTGLGLSNLAGALRPFFPEWSDDLPPLPEPAEDATASRHRLFRALTELLDRQEVTLLVLEDGHWADEATLEWLLYLTSRESPQV
ncbi:MAG TPA: AAA family ATPase, partial [Streptosporangiaceae bacterium]|nr:AAA family ATPase [Streptosporangiaceae bacterium]